MGSAQKCRCPQGPQVRICQGRSQTAALFSVLLKTPHCAARVGKTSDTGMQRGGRVEVLHQPHIQITWGTLKYSHA